MINRKENVYNWIIYKTDKVGYSVIRDFGTWNNRYGLSLDESVIVDIERKEWTDTGNGIKQVRKNLLNVFLTYRITYFQSWRPVRFQQQIAGDSVCKCTSKTWTRRRAIKYIVKVCNVPSNFSKFDLNIFVSVFLEEKILRDVTKIRVTRLDDGWAGGRAVGYVVTARLFIVSRER